MSICGGTVLSLCLNLTSSVYPHQLSSACFLNRLCVELLTHYDEPSIGASALFCLPANCHRLNSHMCFKNHYDTLFLLTPSCLPLRLVLDYFLSFGLAHCRRVGQCV